MNWIRENINDIPSFAPFYEHIDVIDKHVSANPALCVETCKSLIEGICKTILTNKSIAYRTDIPFHGLVHLTITSIINHDETFRTDLTDLGSRIAGVAHKLGDIRNNAGFISHGMDVLNPKLTATVSHFTYKITDTIGGFILNCYNNHRAVSKDHRIHYNDCKVFNEYLDSSKPMELGAVKLSISRALYNEDYEAYKESYFEYLVSLENNEVE